MNKSEQTIPPEIQALIPFYINGSATEEEKEIVSSFLSREEEEWERQVHSEIVDELSVPEAVIDNDLRNFKARLEQESADKTATTERVSLRERIQQFFESLLPVPALGMAAVAAICVAVVLGVVSRSELQAPGNLVDGYPMTRGCESGEQKDVPRQYRFTLQTSADLSVDADVLDRLVTKAFPNTNYTMSHSQTDSTIVVNGTDCDPRIHELARELEDLPMVQQVRISNVGG